MRYFPFFFDLRRKRLLIIGGGEVAERKAALLTRAGAILIIVAPHIRASLQTIAEQSGGEVHHKPFAAADLDSCTAAVVAVGDDAVNKQVIRAARHRRVPVNVVDNPKHCDFIFPAIAERGAVVAAVSSGGDSPVLARILRARLEEQMPPRLGDLAAMFGEWRDVVADAKCRRNRTAGALFATIGATLQTKNKTAAAKNRRRSGDADLMTFNRRESRCCCL